MGEVNVMFKEPMHKIIDRIKNEPYFRWPNKMRDDLSRKNQNLYCTVLTTGIRSIPPSNAGC